MRDKVSRESPDALADKPDFLKLATVATIPLKTHSDAKQNLKGLAALPHLVSGAISIGFLRDAWLCGRKIRY